jgi:hypothetical protein
VRDDLADASAENAISESIDPIAIETAAKRRLAVDGINCLHVFGRGSAGLAGVGRANLVTTSDPEDM